MSELQKYYLYAVRLSDGSAQLVESEDSQNGKHYYCRDVDARLALMHQEATANHKVLQQALDGCDRLDQENARLLDQVALMQRALEWSLSNGARHYYAQQNWNDETGRYPYAWEIGVESGNPVPAEFAEIIIRRQP